MCLIPCEISNWHCLGIDLSQNRVPFPLAVFVSFVRSFPNEKESETHITCEVLMRVFRRYKLWSLSD